MIPYILDTNRWKLFSQNAADVIIITSRYDHLNMHGFLEARSCLTNMLCFLEEITKWIDEGSPVDIIYLDFQKAFAKAPYQRLLITLKADDIGDGIIDSIEQWLTDRKVDGEVSNRKSVLSGIPQGSVLGPLFFLYI